MPAYLVRFADTKTFAGFYAADSKDDLFDLIDEETYPGDYESALIKPGFGIAFRKDDWAVKYKIGSGAKALAAAFGKADTLYITDVAHRGLTRGEDLVWKRLYQD